jgi:hypothetical protein
LPVIFEGKPKKLTKTQKQKLFKVATSRYKEKEKWSDFWGQSDLKMDAFSRMASPWSASF